MPNFTSTCLWQATEGRGSPSLCARQPSSPTAQSWLQLSQLRSPSQQSPQGQVVTGVLERCRSFFPAVGRNQTLLKLVVLPSAEFTSTPDVPLKHRLHPIPEVLAADLPQQTALGKSLGR